MSVKELTNITLKDLWKEYKRINNFWEAEEKAVVSFSVILIMIRVLRGLYMLY